MKFDIYTGKVHVSKEEFDSLLAMTTESEFDKWNTDEVPSALENVIYESMMVKAINKHIAQLERERDMRQALIDDCMKDIIVDDGSFDILNGTKEEKE